MNSTVHGALPVGTRSCEVASILGIGGFGITYKKGYDHSLHCDVVIKEYLPSGLALRTADGATVSPKSDQDSTRDEIEAFKLCRHKAEAGEVDAKLPTRRPEGRPTI